MIGPFMRVAGTGRWMRRGFRALALACALIGPSPHPDSGAAEAAAGAGWQPPAPEPDAADWLQLVSGEWLRGDLEHMRDEVVEFDSDELDDLRIDWEDVAAFHLAEPQTFRFEGRILVRGSAELRDGVIRIRREDDEMVQFERAKLVAITAGSGSERDFWTGKIGAGFTARSGNTDQTDLSGSARITRETALTRFRTAYSGVISTVDNDKTANNHRVSSALDFYLTRRLYLTIPAAEYFTDEFSNIELRITSGAGVGYELVDRSWVEWDVALQSGYQYTRFEQTSSGSGESDDLAVIFITDLDFDLPRGVELDNHYQIQGIPTDPGATNHNLVSTLSFDLWGPLDLDVSFTWDRIWSPESESAGSKPKSDDFRTEILLAIDF